MPVAKRTSDKSTTTPYWKSECGRVVIYVGDCREVLSHLEREHFYAVVTDPPYDLIAGGLKLRTMKYSGNGTDRTKQDNYKAGGFMNQKWDGTGVAFDPKTWDAVSRVAKPGAHLLAFGGTRTWHRMACAIEDSGFEIRDTIMYCYGSGFPKSHNVSKAIDKELGAERKKVRHPARPETSGTMSGASESRPWIEQSRELGYHETDGDEPVTDAARQWQGWGTALKPAFEPIILARRPFPGTVAQCVMENGTGGLNIDGCLVGSSGGTTSTGEPNHLNQVYGAGMGGLGIVDGNKGRWPANFIHDGSDEVVELFPNSSSSSAVMPLPKTPGDAIGADHGNSQHRPTLRGHNDEGSAARFFYTAKADDDDRPHGKGKHVTTHPTVKPLDLMQYLVRLVCVKGGTILDPFMGSGSTGCAAILEGMRFVGIEQSQEYADIAVGRLKLALEQRNIEDTPEAPAAPNRRTDAAPPAPRRLRGG